VIRKNKKAAKPIGLIVVFKNNSVINAGIPGIEVFSGVCLFNKNKSGKNFNFCRSYF
jgi:hypothetical protein